MKKNITVLAVFTCALISYGMSSPVDNTASKETSKHSVKHEQVYTKPHAGIELNYNRPKNLQAGDSFDLVLNFKTKTNADSLNITIKNNNDLQLGLSQFDYQFSAVKNNKNTITIPVTALHDGRFFIDIMAILMVNGNEQARTFVIPVTVGDQSNVKVKPAKGYNSLPSQGVISMPATETTE